MYWFTLCSCWRKWVHFETSRSPVSGGIIPNGFKYIYKSWNLQVFRHVGLNLNQITHEIRGAINSINGYPSRMGSYAILDFKSLTLSWPAGHTYVPLNKESFQVRWDNSIQHILHAAIYLEVSLFRWTTQNEFSHESAMYKWYCVQCCYALHKWLEIDYIDIYMSKRDYIIVWRCVPYRQILTSELVRLICAFTLEQVT
jgi:hypothetical protein